MNIKAVKKSDILPAYIEGKLTYAGEIKEKDGIKRQTIILSEDDEDLNVVLRGSYAIFGRNHINKFVRILSSKAKNGSIIGVKVKESKNAGKYFVVDSPSILIPDIDEHNKQNESVKEEAKLIKEEKQEGVKEEETPYHQLSPVYKDIENIVKERLLIYEACRDIIEKEEESKFPLDKIPELATSVHIEISRRGHKILPPHQRKERFIEKKNPDPKKEEEAQPASERDRLMSYLDSSKTEEWYNIKTTDGVKVGDLLRDDKKRGKIASWYYNSCTARERGEIKSEKSTKVHDSITNLINKSGCSLAEDAIYNEYISITDSDFYAEQAEQVANEVISHYYSKLPEPPRAPSPVGIAKHWFDLPYESRRKIIIEVYDSIKKIPV
jgi:hypothetical protein